MRRALQLLSGLTLLLISAPAFGAELAVPQQPAIDYVVEQGIMGRDASGEFHDSSLVTRYDLLHVVIGQAYRHDDPDNCYGKLVVTQPATFTLLFRDVPAAAPHAPYICIGMIAGLVNGSQDGSFYPSRAITTAEASKILARAYGLYEIGCDEPAGAPWYQTYMWVLRKQGALPQTADSATHLLTRGELAAMLYGLRDRPLALQEDLEAARAIVAKANAPESKTVASAPTAPKQAVTAAPSPVQPEATMTTGSSAARAAQAIRLRELGREPTIRGVPLSVFLQRGAAPAGA